MSRILRILVNVELEARIMRYYKTKSGVLLNVPINMVH